MKPTADPLYSYVEFHARYNPHAHAVRYPGGVVSYRQFRSHIDAVTARLAESGLPKGSSVSMWIAHPYLHWILIFAAQRLGFVASALGESASEVRILKPDAVLTDAPQKFAGIKVIAASPEWLNSTGQEKSASTAPTVECLPTDPTRIVLSSGTTGMPKKALFTFAQLTARVDATVRVYQLTSQTAFIGTIGMTTIGGLVLPLCVWAAGGTVLMPTRNPGEGLWKTLEARPNTMFMSTAQLGELLRSLPTDYEPAHPLRIFVAGSPLPIPVNRAVRTRLSHDIVNVYGSTEVGTVCISNGVSAEVRPDLTGFVVPQCEVQVVGDDGKPLPHGTPGDVRVRVAGMCDGYLDDPKSHAECFRDGWFHPGDLGVLGQDNSLSIMGRTRELMNFNGVKLAPHLLEEALANFPGVKELAIFSYPNRDGLQRPCVAVVPGDGFDEKALEQYFRAQFPRLPVATVLRVAAIPRNDMGKVSRAELAQSLAEPLKAFS